MSLSPFVRVDPKTKSVSLSVYCKDEKQLKAVETVVGILKYQIEGLIKKAATMSVYLVENSLPTTPKDGGVSRATESESP